MGGCSSVTRTTNEPRASFGGEAASRATQVTVVSPMTNNVPDGGEHSIVTASPSGSTALGGPPGTDGNVTRSPTPLVAATGISASVSTGGPRSRTVTSKRPKPWLPAPSIDRQVTVVVPIGNVAPDAGVQVTSQTRIRSPAGHETASVTDTGRVGSSAP